MNLAPSKPLRRTWLGWLVTRILPFSRSFETGWLFGNKDPQVETWDYCQRCLRHQLPQKRGAVVGLVVLGLLAGAQSGARAQSDWQPIECIPAELPPEALYEVATPMADFEETMFKWSAAEGNQQAKATLQLDSGEHHGGSSALRVDYEFIGKKDLEYVQVNGAAEFARPGQAFGFWVKQVGPPLAIRLRITDASGECHQIDMLASASTGWQFVACALDGTSSAWGGDGNQRKDYPCKLAGICLDRPRVGFVGKGSLWLDDVAVLQPAKQAPTRALQVETRGRRFGNLYAVGDTVSLRARGEGERLRWSVTDFFGHQLNQGEGPASATEITFPLKQPGWFSCKLELLAGGQAVGTQLFRCAALPGGAESARSDFVGVCSHFGQSTYPVETMSLMQRYGIDQFRDEISWGAYEREKGQLAMPGFAATFLQRAAELKMRPLLIFDYANRHYDNGGYPNSPAAIEAFGRYAVDLVRQTRGKVAMFEVWNEWVGGCGMNGRPGQHDGEAYGRLLQPTYRAVKQAFPDVTVVGIGGEYGAHCAENILGAIRTAGTNSMDAWSIHPYRYPHGPEFSDLVGEVNRIQAKVAQTGEKTKAWVTEIGYPTHRGGSGSEESAQARYLVRTLALLQSTRVVEKVFWYDLKDDGLTRDYNEHNFGLIRHQQFNCAPKPGMVALSAFIRLTAGAEFQELRRAEGIYLAKYRRPDGSHVLLVWSDHGRRVVRIAGEVVGVHDLMGKVIPAATAGGVEADENPVYVIGRSLGVTAK